MTTTHDTEPLDLRTTEEQAEDEAAAGARMADLLREIGLGR